MTRKQTKRIFSPLGSLFCGLLVLSAVFPSSVMAQSCDINVEEIMRLRPPSFDNYTVWDETYGGEGMEQFSDFTVLIDGSVVAGGAYTKDTEDSVYKPLLVHMNEKGEALWETREESKTFKTINSLIPVKGGYLVLGDQNDPGKGNGIYVALYGEDGKRKSQWPIYERGGNLDSKSIVLSSDGKSVLIAAQLNPEGKTDGQYGVLYKYTLGGKRVWRHGYSPGMRSVFHNLTRSADGGYIVSGEMQIEDSRMGAWLIRVDDNGAIMWQRTYARGNRSAILSAASTEGGILLSGEVKPIGSARTSGWVMKVDLSGRLIWQRYYAGAYNYAARDLVVYDDGRASVLVDATPNTLLDRGHLRLMTFSPRGYLMNVEEFSEGQGAHAFRLVKGPKGERVMSGYAQMSYAEVPSVNEIPVSTFNAWLVAAPSLDPYEDPCLPKSYLP